jgi:hypothetical protein
MSTGVTAAHILRQLDAHRIGAQMSALAALDSVHQDEVRRALSRVKRGARIDLPVLIATVKRELLDRSTGMPPTERAEFQQFVRDDLARWRAECDQRGVTPGEPAAYGLMLQMQTAAAPPSIKRYDDDLDLDDDLDDDIDEKPRQRSKERRKPKRRSLPRRKLLRLEKRPRREPEQPSRYFGPRLFGVGADDRPYGRPVDYSPNYEHFDPPWLLSAGEDDEPDRENDDERVRA